MTIAVLLPPTRIDIIIYTPRERECLSPYVQPNCAWGIVLDRISRVVPFPQSSPWLCETQQQQRNSAATTNSMRRASCCCTFLMFVVVVSNTQFSRSPPYSVRKTRIHRWPGQNCTKGWSTDLGSQLATSNPS